MIESIETAINAHKKFYGLAVADYMLGEKNVIRPLRPTRTGPSSPLQR
jgi:hypothetical protein